MNTVSYCGEFRDPTSDRSQASLRARLLAVLRAWVERSRGREQLRGLDERLLQDIGVRYEDALLEARKPFWKP